MCCESPLQEVLAQRNATLEQLVSLRVCNAKQYALADAAADAAYTEEASARRLLKQRATIVLVYLLFTKGHCCASCCLLREADGST